MDRARTHTHTRTYTHLSYHCEDPQIYLGTLWRHEDIVLHFHFADGIHLVAGGGGAVCGDVAVN